MSRLHTMLALSALALVLAAAMLCHADEPYTAIYVRSDIWPSVTNAINRWCSDRRVKQVPMPDVMGWSAGWQDSTGVVWYASAWSCMVPGRFQLTNSVAEITTLTNGFAGPIKSAVRFGPFSPADVGLTPIAGEP